MEVRAARALWITDPETADIRECAPGDAEGCLQITTLYSGISRGTERLVFRGEVPPSEHQTMRAPFQEGDFAFPVKYGYAAVGRVESGDRAGEIVFALHPHQTRFCVPDEAAVPVPAFVPAARAVLAANMETALNILWDAAVQPGDRVVVVGAGVVGALAAYLCARMPGMEVCLIDVNPHKAQVAEALGCAFALPTEVPTGADVVIHTSASSDGLATAIDAAGVEAIIAEASWYGTKPTTVPLGAAFHQKRLRIIGTQVGRIPAHRAARWSYRRRLLKALELLADPVLDVLICGETAFDDVPLHYGSILADPATLCHRIRYPE
jgi:NADPH:quinone reductase-like Zn-dependent oxidoreductase